MRKTIIETPGNIVETKRGVRGGIKAPSGKAAAYIRVSTADQGERYSLPSQLKALRDVATRNQKQIPEEWVFIDKHTGKLSSRPAFDKLKALVRTGAPDCVYIYDVSRFARKTMDSLWLAAEFKRYGVGLDFVEMPYQDTPTGRLTFTQMAAVAEFLGEKIIEDSTRGRREKLESGKLDHGSAPDGYKYIDKRQKENGSTLAVNPPRAKIWQDIFRWRGIDHMAKYAIAKRLNDAGIPSARGAKWVPRVLGQNLSNRTYIGEHMRAGIIVPCPAIITRELFEACQRFNQQSQEQNVGRPSNQYLLRGFVWCSKCSKRIITNPGGSGHHPYYRCGNIEYTPYTRLCHAPLVYCDHLEPAAWQAIWEVITDPDLLLKLGKAHYDAQEKKTVDSKPSAELESERTKLREKIKTTRRMMQDSYISYAEGGADIRTCEGRIEQLDRELAEAAGIIVMDLPPRNQVEAWCREISSGPEPETYEERRPILEAIGELRMRYYKPNLEITGKIRIPVVSTTCNQKNSDKAVSADPNSFASIPFILRRKVA